MAEPKNGDGGNRTHAKFPPKKSPVGYVYFIQEKGDDGAIKIGWTRTKEGVKGRLKHLACGSSRGLRLRGFSPGPRAYERHLHWHFAEHRLSGEWFKPAPDIELMATVAEQRDKTDDETRAAYEELAQRILDRSVAPDGPFEGKPAPSFSFSRRQAA